MTTKTKFQNYMAVYTLGSMLNNYLDCLKLPYNKLDQEGKKEQRRMNDVKLSVTNLLEPVNYSLNKINAFDIVEQSIFVYHDTVDEVFGLNERELKRVNTLIKKIVRERKPEDVKEIEEAFAV